MSRSYKPRPKFAAPCKVFVFQFLLQKVDGDTVIGCRHIGNEVYRLTLRTPEGERYNAEMNLAGSAS